MKRLKNKKDRRRRKLIGKDAMYHCSSRLANGAQFFKNAKAKDIMRCILDKTAYFSGINIASYCIMDNHFHVVAKISVKEQHKEISDDELINRVHRLYNNSVRDKRYAEEVERSLRENDEDSDNHREDLKNRMGDISKFMQNFKQRFSICYNRNFSNMGSIWDNRFNSEVTEYRSNYSIEMALYADLNPLRAGMVEDPLMYPHCGYSEAVRDPNSEIRYNLMDLLQKDTWEETMRDYRVMLFARGAKSKSDGSGRLIDSKLMKKVITSDGKLSNEQIELVKQLYLEYGEVIGDKEMVERVMKEGRAFSGGEKLPEAVGALRDNTTGVVWYAPHRLKSRKSESDMQED